MILSELLQKHSTEQSWCTWWLTQNNTAYGQMCQWSTHTTGDWMKPWFRRCQFQTSIWCFLVWVFIVLSVYCLFLSWNDWFLMRSSRMTLSYMLQTQVVISLAVLELFVWERPLSDDAPLLDSPWSSAVSSFASVFVTICYNTSF